MNKARLLAVLSLLLLSGKHASADQHYIVWLCDAPAGTCFDVGDVLTCQSGDVKEPYFCEGKEPISILASARIYDHCNDTTDRGQTLVYITSSVYLAAGSRWHVDSDEPGACWLISSCSE